MRTKRTKLDDLDGLHALLVERNRVRLELQEIENRVAATLAHLENKIAIANDRTMQGVKPAPEIVRRHSHLRD